MKTVGLKFRVNGVDYFAKTFLDTPIQIDRVVQDFRQVESTQAEITQLPFRIPLVDNLIQAFGDLTDPTYDTNIDIRKNIKGSINIDGFPEYTGRFNIIKIHKTQTTKELELIFKSDLSSLKSRLVNIKLKDLLAGETLPYTMSEIVSAIANPASYLLTNGYLWPLIDYGHEFTGDTNATTGTLVGDADNRLNQTHFKPAIQLKKIIELLEADQDLELTWDSSIDDLVEGQFIPLHNNNNSLPVLNTSEGDYTGEMTNSALRASTITFTSGATVISRVGQYDAKTLYNSSFDGFDLAADDFTAPYTGAYTFKTGAEHVLTAPVTSYVILARYRYEINGTPVNFPGLQLVYMVAPNTSPQTYTFNAEFSLDLTAGDVVTVRWDYEPVVGTYPFTYNLTIQNEFFRVTRVPSITASSTVLIDQNIDKDLTAWDIVGTIIKQSNSILERNNDDSYNIKPYNIWIDEGVDFDISDKVEFDTTMSIEPTSVTGAKSIKFTYQEDEDFYNKAYKDLENEIYGTLEIEDTGSDFATKKVEITMPFAPTPIAPVTSTSLVIPKFVDENFEVVKTKPRLLYYNAEFFRQPLFFEDIFGGTFSSDTVPYFGHWETPDGGFTDNDNNFGQSLTFFRSTGYPNNNLYKRFWEKYVTETYGINGRAMTVPLKLTASDLSTLKMNERVLYNGGRWRFIKLSGINLAQDSLVMATLLFMKEIENVDIAPYYPTDVNDLSVVQWANSSTNASVGDASGEPAADVEASANAYGFYYDSVQNISLQRGKILIR